jgi:hypothetical protein
VDPATGAVTTVGDTGGGANAAALAADGSFLVTQNGGFDMSAYEVVQQPQPVRWMDPGLQLVSPGGDVSYLTSKPLQAPNDLVVAQDGTIYFTDPEHAPPTQKISRVLAYRHDGTIDVIVMGFGYVNGIAFDLDQTTLVVVADDRRLLRLRDFGRGEREYAVADLGESGGDGFCLDEDGLYYVATRLGSGVKIFDTDGTEVDFLAVPAGGFITNCCFGGSDMRTLFATDAGRNTLWAWKGMPTAGLRLNLWPGRSA